MNRKAALAELQAFPAGWTNPEFTCDRPGREFNAGGFYLLVSCNQDVDEKLWWTSVFFGGDTEAAWTKDGFPSAAAARSACVSQALRMLRECKDALQKADGR